MSLNAEGEPKHKDRDLKNKKTNFLSQKQSEKIGVEKKLYNIFMKFCSMLLFIILLMKEKTREGREEGS